jgi:hypothetical protein
LRLGESWVQVAPVLDRSASVHSGRTLALQSEKRLCRATVDAFRIPVAVLQKPRRAWAARRDHLRRGASSFHPLRAGLWARSYSAGRTAHPRGAEDESESAPFGGEGRPRSLCHSPEGGTGREIPRDPGRNKPNSSIDAGHRYSATRGIGRRMQSCANTTNHEEDAMMRGSMGIVETAVVGRSWPAPGDTTSAGALSSERGPRGSIVWGNLALRPERSRCPLAPIWRGQGVEA